MKKKRWKLAGIFLMAALTVPSLGGCKVGNTQIRLSSGQLRNHNAIVRINDHKYDIRYAKLYLCNYRNLYGKAYGTDLWESYDADLEQYVKDVTIQELTHIACMDILAENQDMHLSEQEKKQAARAAKEYYQSLTEEEKTFIGLYEREIRTAYEEYALAEKLYHALTQGTDEEVSDDEARVVRVQQIYVKEKEALRAVQENLAAGDDFASVASAYNQSREFERTIARGTYPDAMEEIVFNLDDGACSDVIAADDDEKELSNIRSLLDSYQKTHNIPFTYQEYHSSCELALRASKERFDIYLLDILMPHMTGMQLAREIRTFDHAADIIFLTTSSDFAVESYTVKATNYLMKPVSSNAFFAAMDDILRVKTQEQGHFLVLKSRIGVHKVPLSELIYVEAQNRKVIYYTSGREQIVCTELFSSVCNSLLQHREFIQVHRSFLVNMNYIRSIGTMDMCLHNGTNIPLAQRRVADIKKHYLAFQMEE